MYRMSGIRACLTLTTVMQSIVTSASVSVTSAVTGSGSTKVEFCQYDQADVSCDQGHVIVVEEALYGYMALGKCIKHDAGQLGCSTDFTDLISSQCSGRPSCQVHLGDLQNRRLDCSTVYTSYLGLQYKCQKVETCPSGGCHVSGYKVRPARDAAVLSGWVASHDGCGGRNCPWLLQGLPGQRFNLTLLDFSDSSQESGFGGGNQCPHLFAVREDGMSRDFTACHYQHRRRSHVYLSNSNSVEIEMTADTIANASQYLLLYEKIGCTEPPVPPHASVARSGNQAVMTCEVSRDHWVLTCRGSEWTGELDKVCPETQLDEEKKYKENKATRASPYGLLVVIGLGVALGVVIGVILLGIALVCMRRRNKRRHGQPRGTLLGEGSPLHDPNKSGVIIHENSPLSHGGTLIYTPEHDYTTTLHPKRALPVPSPLVPADSSQLQTEGHFECQECAVAQAGPAEFKLGSSTHHGKYTYETPSFPFHPGSGTIIQGSDAAPHMAGHDESRKTN